MDFLKEFSKQFSSKARSASEKGREGSEASRLGAELKSAEASLDSLYDRFGRACYALRTGGGNADAAEELALRIRATCLQVEELTQALNAVRELKRCPGCGAVFPKEARFCSTCGRKLPEEAPRPEPVKVGEYCPTCGAEMAKGETVCPVCGTDLAGPTPPAPHPDCVPDAPGPEEPSEEMD